MWKRTALASIAIFIAWSALDFLTHGLILQPAYTATAELWRPMEEMKMGLIYLTTLIGSVCFATIYASLIHPKTLQSGIRYGLLFGLAVGASMGYGTYSVMPIPYYMALVWFLGTSIQGVVAGMLAAWIVRP